MSRISVTGQVYLQSQFQWTPTLTSHDPSYIITINDPPAALVTSEFGLHAIEQGVVGSQQGLCAIDQGRVP
jgi:hypothetical protein